jgi:hypothetical protein
LIAFAFIFGCMPRQSRRDIPDFDHHVNGLQGGIGEVNILILLCFLNFRTSGTRPARRLTFCPNGHKT